MKFTRVNDMTRATYSLKVTEHLFQLYDKVSEECLTVPRKAQIMTNARIMVALTLIYHQNKFFQLSGNPD
jgi:hypothetical protein